MFFKEEREKKMITKYEIDERQVNGEGIVVSEIYDNLEEATNIFESLKEYESAGSKKKIYSLNELKFVLDEKDEDELILVENADITLDSFER